MKTVMLLIIAVFGGVSLYAADFKDSKSAFNAARKLEYARKYQEAVKGYLASSKLAKTPKESLKALYRAGLCLASEKKYEEGVRIILPFAENPGISLPLRAESFLNCARIIRNRDRKIYFCDRGLALKCGSPAEGELLVYKSEQLVHRRRFAEAEKILQSLSQTSRYGTNIQGTACSALVRLKVVKNDFKAALSCCDKLRELAGNKNKSLLLESELQRIKVKLAQNKLDEAVKLSTAIAADSRFSSRDRGNAIINAIAIDLNWKMDPRAAQKHLELFRRYNIPMNQAGKVYEKDLKILLKK